MWVRSLGWEDPQEEGMATHSSIIAWRIPWAEEPGGAIHSHKESDRTEVTVLSITSSSRRNMMYVNNLII